MNPFSPPFQRAGIRIFCAISNGWRGGFPWSPPVQRADVDVALAVAGKIRTRVAEAPFATSAGDLPITLSLGVAAGRTGAAVDDVIRRADSALYRAKENGRDRVEAG